MVTAYKTDKPLIIKTSKYTFMASAGDYIVTKIVYSDDEAIVIFSKQDIVSYDEFFMMKLKKIMTKSYKTNYKI